MPRRVRTTIARALQARFGGPWRALSRARYLAGGNCPLPATACEDVPVLGSGSLPDPLLMTCKSGVIRLDGAVARRVLRGRFYGLTRHADRWYAFHRTTPSFGQIVSFHLGNQGAADLRCEIPCLHADVHQIDFCADRLYVADSGNNRLLKYDATRLSAGPLHVSYPAGRAWRGRLSANYVHLNSVLTDGSTLLVVFHNDTRRSGRRSELACLDDDFRICGRYPLDAGCAHNVVLVDGQIGYCDSMAGAFVLGRARLDLGSFTRGVAVAANGLYVGGSAFTSRERRDGSDGTVHYCSRDGLLRICMLTLPAVGGVYDVRLLDSADLGCSEALSQSTDLSSSLRQALMGLRPAAQPQAVG